MVNVFVTLSRLSCLFILCTIRSVFFQVQSLFGHLMDSKLQFFAPEQFWKCFKLWGQPVNVREQQVGEMSYLFQLITMARKLWRYFKSWESVLYPYCVGTKIKEMIISQESSLLLNKLSCCLSIEGNVKWKV